MPLDVQKLRSPGFKELFEKTGDLRYALLAIGKEPRSPPEWAVMACAIYYEQEQISIPSPKSGRAPKFAVEDGLALDRVAELVVRDGFSATKAVMEVTGEGTDGTNFRRLMRHWKNDMKPATLQAATGKAQKTNRWLRLADQREYERFLDDVLAQAKAEIAAGNLNVEEDAGKKSRRESRARWFQFSSEMNPDQDARLRIAPLDRDAWVKEIKQHLLSEGSSQRTDDDGL